MRLIGVFFVLSTFICNAQLDCYTFDDGKSGLCQSFYENGKIKAKGRFKNGVRHGTFEEYYEDGKNKSIQKFKDGFPEGVQIGYYESGGVKFEGEYTRGYGEVKEYSADGVIMSFRSYMNYSLNEEVLYDENGVQIAEIFEDYVDPVDPYEGNEVLRQKVNAIYYKQNDFEFVIEQKEAEGQVRTVKDKIVELAVSDFPEVEAEFFGGASAMSQFIVDNVHYPYLAIERNIQGRVYASFVVEADGSISNIRIERGVHELLDKETIRLILIMPKWIPGEVKGRTVRTRCRLPINYSLN